MRLIIPSRIRMRRSVNTDHLTFPELHARSVVQIVRQLTRHEVMAVKFHC